MSGHPFDSGFALSAGQKARFQRDGFVKLEGFLSGRVVDTLLDRVEVEMGRGVPRNFKSDELFTRAKYDFETDKTDVYALMERPYFRRALTELVERDLFLTFEICFELEKEVDEGFPWHVGTQSFGYQVVDEFGCTLWVPLHPVDSDGQGGGLACVPMNVLSGEFIYHQFEPAVVSTLEAKERAGVRTSVGDYFGLRKGLINSPAMLEVLEAHRIEDDFERGDALLFNKMVLHRSVMLGDGTLPRRAAYVMRFVDASSHYDLKRARALDFPVEKYGKGFFAYKPFTRQHIEIAEAGARDGDVLAECGFFGNRDRRTLRRDAPP